jgi:hypothetical protein
MMRQIIMQIFSTIVAGAALIGIKELALPFALTALLVAATVVLCILLMSGAFFRKRSTDY